MDAGTTLLRTTARAGGEALASAAAVLSRGLQRTKPLHPDGEVRAATVERLGSTPPGTGVPFLDLAGTTPALVRISRGVGLPAALPDVDGLAIRLDLDEGPADVLLAATGTGRVTRYLLTPRRWGRPGPMTTLLPYRSPRGALEIAAFPDGERTYELRWALGTGPWRTFALLRLGTVVGHEGPSFDPVLHPLPGLEQYGWVTRLREPAYRTARWLSSRAA
jgi:hypothetical protein